MVDGLTASLDGGVELAAGELNLERAAGGRGGGITQDVAVVADDGVAAPECGPGVEGAQAAGQGGEAGGAAFEQALGGASQASG